MAEVVDWGYILKIFAANFVVYVAAQKCYNCLILPKDGCGSKWGNSQEKKNPKHQSLMLLKCYDVFC